MRGWLIKEFSKGGGCFNLYSGRGVHFFGEVFYLPATGVVAVVVEAEIKVDGLRTASLDFENPAICVVASPGRLCAARADIYGDIRVIAQDEGTLVMGVAVDRRVELGRNFNPIYGFPVVKPEGGLLSFGGMRSAPLAGVVEQPGPVVDTVERVGHSAAAVLRAGATMPAHLDFVGGGGVEAHGAHRVCFPAIEDGYVRGFGAVRFDCADILLAVGADGVGRRGRVHVVSTSFFDRTPVFCAVRLQI